MEFKVTIVLPESARQTLLAHAATLGTADLLSFLTEEQKLQCRRNAHHGPFGPDGSKAGSLSGSREGHRSPCGPRSPRNPDISFGPEGVEKDRS